MRGDACMVVYQVLQGARGGLERSQWCHHMHAKQRDALAHERWRLHAWQGARTARMGGKV